MQARVISLFSQKQSIYFCFFCSFLILARLFLCNSTLGLDEAEQIVFAQNLAAGYPSQPPLYTWLQYVFFQAFGQNLFSVALLKYGLLSLGFLLYFKICRLYCQDSLLTWCATLAWTLIPNISYDLLPHRTHLILALDAACLTWYWLIKPSRLTPLNWSVVFGSILSLGLLSKFNYLLFLFLLLMTALSIKKFRNKLLTPYLLITVLIALSLSSPYWFWLLKNSNLGFYSTYKLTLAEKTQWDGLRGVFKASSCYLIPFALIPLFFSLSWKKNLTEETRLLFHFHVLIVPFLLLTVICGSVHNIKTHWLLPLFFLLPLTLFSRIEKTKFSPLAAKSFLSLCITLQLLLVGVWILRTPYLAKFPVNQLIEKIKSRNELVRAIISDSHWLLGSVLLQLPNKGILIHPSMLPQFPSGNLLFLWEGEQVPLWLNHLALTSPQLMTKVITIKNNEAAASLQYLKGNLKKKLVRSEVEKKPEARDGS